MRWRLLLLVLFSVSCETVPATQVVVFLDADGAIVDRAESVEVMVIGTGPDGATDGTSYDVGPGGDFGFPLRISVLPQDGDASRRFRFTATASDGEGALVTVRAEMGFAADEALGVRLLLEGACIDQACGSNETCRGGTCTDDIDVDDEQFELDENGHPAIDAGAPTDGPDPNTCEDRDGDGFPATDPGCIAEAYDCDDDAAAVFPGAPASCGSGVIEDCRARALEVELVADAVRFRGAVDTDDVEAAMGSPEAGLEPRMAVAYLVEGTAWVAVGAVGESPVPATVDLACLEGGGAFLDVGFVPDTSTFEVAVATEAPAAGAPWLGRIAIGGDAPVCRDATAALRSFGVAHLFGNGGGEGMGFGTVVGSIEGIIARDRYPDRDYTFAASRPERGWATSAAAVGFGGFEDSRGAAIAGQGSDGTLNPLDSTLGMVGRGAMVRVGDALHLYWGNGEGRLIRRTFSCAATSCSSTEERTGTDADLGPRLSGTPALLAAATLGSEALLAHRNAEGGFALTKAGTALSSRPLPEIDALGTVLDLELVGQPLEDGTLRYVVLALIDAGASTELHELVFRGCSEP